MPRPFAKVAASPGRHLVGGEAAVLPAVDDRREHAARPALLVDVGGFDLLLQQPDLIVDVEDGEVALQPDEFGMAAQDLHADRMEGAEPRHALDDLPDHRADAGLHLARGLVGEGDREDFGRPRLAETEDVGDARCQHARLAGSGARQHQHRAVERLDRLALFRIEAVQIRRRHIGARARRDPAGGGRRSSGKLLTRNLCHQAALNIGFQQILCPENGIAPPLWRGVGAYSSPPKGRARTRSRASSITTMLPVSSNVAIAGRFDKTSSVCRSGRRSVPRRNRITDGFD